jgi:hypothetical protein
VAPAVGPAGYAHRAYAEALAEFGTPLQLPRSDGWLLERAVADSARRDAMGCYPLFSCRDWSSLAADLDALEGRLVSLVLIADPFGDHAPADLERWFPALARPFKEHLVVALDRPLTAFVDPHHQRNARKALRDLSVEHVADPTALARDWCDLYGALIARHGITGLTAFSPASFEKQLGVPGLEMFCARRDGEIVGITLWFRQGDAAYYHLGASSEQGYRYRASFASFWRALEHFADSGVTRVDLGAGAGLGDGAGDGLSRFKRGWATGSRPAWLCGRIFDPGAYAALTAARGQTGSAYFPAYRTGEFG